MPLKYHPLTEVPGMSVQTDLDTIAMFANWSDWAEVNAYDNNLTYALDHTADSPNLILRFDAEGRLTSLSVEEVFEDETGLNWREYTQNFEDHEGNLLGILMQLAAGTGV